MSAKVTKDQSRSRTYTRSGLVMYMTEHCRILFLLSVAFTGLASVFDLVGPKIVEYTVDLILSDEDRGVSLWVLSLIDRLGGRELLRAEIWRIALMVLGVALCAAVLRYLSQMCGSRGAERMVKQMRDRLFAHIIRLPETWYGQNHTGDLIQRCTSDVDTVKSFVADQLTTLIRVILLILLSCIFMVGIDLRMTLVAMAFLPVIVGYSFFFHVKIGETFLQADTEEGKVSAMVQENLTGIRVVRAFGREMYEKERFLTKNKAYTALWVRLMRLLSAFWATSDLISGLQVMSVMVLGAVLCVHGEMNTGSYIAFVSYNAMLIWPVRELGRVISDLSKAGVSMDRILAVLNSSIESERPGSGGSALGNEISFRNVSFRYPGAASAALRDVSFTIPAGATVGIIGGTGSGKTTLVRLLTALYDLPEDSGEILLGGRSLRDWDRDEIRNTVSVVTQEPFLFSGTIRENLRIALPEEEKEERIEKNGEISDKSGNAADSSKADPLSEAEEVAIRRAALTGTLERFTRGIETPVGERGVTLSGGQKQRLAIARMLMKHGSVMIFDDSLSAVDASTDRIIRDRLEEMRSTEAEGERPTVIMIAHRITTVMNADLIIVMDHGTVSQMGTHEELIKQEGIYQKIFSLQTAE
ncbi:MAG: ABC transporter ATP-binding protein [Lachnospiraceae bacterium]|nr:ABC transporter ATP-binding protein [Lachnospiraceae bacterium]